MSYPLKRARREAAFPATLRDSRRLFMKKCSICGRETNVTYNLYGYKEVCSKHMHQIFKYGKPLDYSEYKGCKDKEVLDKITEEIMQNIIELAK